MTDKEYVLDYCKNQYGSEFEFPWNDDNLILRHPENRKWYLLIMRIDISKLGVDDSRLVDVMNLKCDTLIADSLIEDMEGVFPGYHMNHKHWISVLLDGSVKREELVKLIDLSFRLTMPKLNRKMR